MIEVVGIGDDGWESLSPRLQKIVDDASVVVGGARHLRMLPDSVAAQAPRIPWPSPLKPELRAFVEGLDAQVVVLASGDPLRSGIASTLIQEFGRDAVRVHPNVSSDTLARARMGWPAETVDVVTLVGRSPERLIPFLTPSAKLVVLCSDGSGPAQVAALLVASGVPEAELTAWWHLGGADEGHRSGTAAQWGAEPTPNLVVVCVEIPDVLPDAAALGASPGRVDSAFEHDGLITKRDVRASALARLRPMASAVLWDLGAGSGAIGLEWALASPRTRVVAVEHDAVRADRVRRNARDWGVEDRVDVVQRSIEEALHSGELPPPDAVFVGGGVSAEVLERSFAALGVGGRLVAHAVTIESEHALREAHGRWGGELVRLSLEYLEPLGRFHSWRPARSIVSWSIVKPQAPLVTSEATKGHDDETGHRSQSVQRSVRSHLDEGAQS